MAKYCGYLLVLSFLLITVYSCERDDDEPSRGVESVSRLFVSTSNYDINSSSPLRNIFIVDPADEEQFPSLNAILSFTSDLKGGNTIYYSDSSNLVFQSSFNYANFIDTAIRVLEVSRTGGIAQVGKVQNRRLTRVRGLAFSRSANQLYVANIGRDTTSILAFNTPRNSGNFSRVSKEVMLDYTPWAIQLVNYDLFVSKAGSNGGVVVYKNFVPELNAGSVQDTMKNIVPSFTLTVEGATNIQGMAYSPSKDILVLTDVSSSARLLVFENFLSYTNTMAITPTRIITGVATKLQQPINVALDNRIEDNWIYVADPGAQRVFRFNLMDTGNTAPNAEMILGANVNAPYVPVSVSLMSIKGDN